MVAYFLFQWKIVFLCKEVGGMCSRRRSQTCQQEAHLNNSVHFNNRTTADTNITFSTKEPPNNIHRGLNRGEKINQIITKSDPLLQYTIHKSDPLLQYTIPKSDPLLWYTVWHNLEPFTFWSTQLLQGPSEALVPKLHGNHIQLCRSSCSKAPWKPHTAMQKLLFQSSMETTYSYADAARSRLFQSSMETTYGYAEALVPKLHGNHIQLSRYIYSGQFSQ